MIQIRKKDLYTGLRYIYNPPPQLKAGDVWSFGVTLWELFTLGETPYGNDVELEGIGAWLAEGNRLETPAFMPRATAAIMTSCWEARPELRPTFRYSNSST